MKRSFYPVIIHLILIFGIWSATHASPNCSAVFPDGDSISGNQLLYNGRIWRDLYISVREDQFLFSYEFLPGTVTIDGKLFKNLKLRYDILNDEILTITDNGLILQLNKEMVDDFAMSYNSRLYKFSNLLATSSNDLTGYVNIRYQGKSALYVKFKKEISKVASGKSYENFVQYDRLYIIHNNIPERLKNKKDLKVLLADRHDEVRKYMKVNRIKVSVKSPDSFIPVLQYYDSLNP